MHSTLAAPAARLAIFQAYLTALTDPGGGARLQSLLAPAAMVPSAAGLRPIAQVDPAEHAGLHAQLAAAGAGTLPDYRDPRLLDGVASGDAGHAVEWFDVLEARSGRHLFVAVGFEDCATDTRIGWSRVAGSIEPCSYRQGYVRSLCDYTWMSRSRPARPRMLLDASYYRLFPAEDVRFDALEDARFSCHMSSVCCRIDFEIDLDPAAQWLIDSIPWSELGLKVGDTRLPVRPDGRLQLKSGDEVCRFLGPQSQCLVHQVTGLQPFATCAVYPYAFAHTPEGVAVAHSSVCPSARAGKGAPPLQDRSDLLERFVQAKPRQTDTYRFDPDTAVPWETFRDVERALLACLALRDIPLQRRLFLAVRTVGAVKARQPLAAEVWLAEPMTVAIDAELRAALRAMIGRILEWDRPTLRELPRQLPARLAAVDFAEPDLLARIMRNMLMSKSYSYEFDLTTALNFAIVLWLVALLMQAATAGPLTELHWQDLGALGMHGMLKQMLRDGVPEGFRGLMGTADFGLWLLAL